jgi:hypothetical protein
VLIAPVPQLTAEAKMFHFFTTRREIRMGKSFGILRLAAVCVFCVLFGIGSALGAIDIPEKFKDIPLYKGSKVQHAMDMDTNAMLTATVDAKSDAIVDFYKNTMKAKGWKVAFQAEQENVKMIHFQKDKQIFQITIQNEKEGGPTTYNMVITAQ